MEARLKREGVRVVWIRSSMWAMFMGWVGWVSEVGGGEGLVVGVKVREGLVVFWMEDSLEFVDGVLDCCSGGGCGCLVPSCLVEVG